MRKTLIRPSLADYADAGALLPAVSSMVGSDHDTAWDPDLNMGVAGGLAPTPNYASQLNSALNNALNNNLGFAAQQSSLQNVAGQLNSQIAQAQAAQAASNFFPHSISLDAVQTKLTRQIQLACDQLPWAIVRRIRNIAFVQEPPVRFSVSFDNGRTLEFADADAFPSEVDIARIALECP